MEATFDLEADTGGGSCCLASSLEVEATLEGGFSSVATCEGAFGSPEPEGVAGAPEPEGGASATAEGGGCSDGTAEATLSAPSPPPSLPDFSCGGALWSSRSSSEMKKT